MTAPCCDCKNPTPQWSDYLQAHLCRACEVKRIHGGSLPPESSTMIARNVSGVNADGRSTDGAQPWEWRPFNAAGEQQDPPVHCRGAAPAKAGGSRPYAFGGDGLAKISEIVNAAGIPRSQVDVLGLQLQGFDVAEIADELKITHEAVRRRSRRAMARLKSEAE